MQKKRQPLVVTMQKTKPVPVQRPLPLSPKPTAPQNSSSRSPSNPPHGDFVEQGRAAGSSPNIIYSGQATIDQSRIIYSDCYGRKVSAWMRPEHLKLHARGVTRNGMHIHRYEMRTLLQDIWLIGNEVYRDTVEVIER